MSLINQVLRDLDARHAPSVDRAALPGDLHALPAEPARSWFKPVLVLVAAGTLSWYLLGGQAEAPEPPLPPVLVQAPAPPAVAEPAPATVMAEAPAPAPAVEAVAPAAPVPARAVAVAAPPQPRNVATKLKLETKLEEKDGAAAEPAAPPPPAPALAKPTTGAEIAPATASIDKRPRTAPANEAADAEYRKAMSALRRGAVGEAFDGLRSALRADKQHISARQALLSLLVEQQRWDEAQALMEEGLALDAAQTGWAMALARLQFEHGKLAEAAETLVRHAVHAEQNADYQAFLALLLQKQQRSAEAARHYRTALALKPNESRWWYGLGLVLESEQKPQEARAAFLKAREIGNLSPDVANAVEQRLR